MHNYLCVNYSHCYTTVHEITTEKSISEFSALYLSHTSLDFTAVFGGTLQGNRLYFLLILYLLQVHITRQETVTSTSFLLSPIEFSKKLRNI